MVFVFPSPQPLKLGHHPAPRGGGCGALPISPHRGPKNRILCKFIKISRLSWPRPHACDAPFPAANSGAGPSSPSRAPRSGGDQIAKIRKLRILCKLMRSPSQAHSGGIAERHTSGTTQTRVIKQSLFTLYQWPRERWPEEPFAGVRIPLKQGPQDSSAGVTAGRH
jgi:hypothetical protein